MPNLCFYSEKCKFSQSFLNELRKSPYISEFKLICVDPDASGKRPPIVDKGRIDKWLTAVPTLIIEGETGPRIDAEVFNWLSMRKLQDGTRRGPESARGSEPGGGGGGNEPMAYGVELTSSKWSDSYSFFDQSFDMSKGQGYDPIPRTFAQLQEGTGELTGGGVSTPGQTVASQKQRSKKEQEMDSRLENFQKQREMDMPRGFVPK